MSESVVSVVSESVPNDQAKEVKQEEQTLQMFLDQTSSKLQMFLDDMEDGTVLSNKLQKHLNSLNYLRNSVVFEARLLESNDPTVLFPENEGHFGWHGLPDGWQTSESCDECVRIYSLRN